MSLSSLCVYFRCLFFLFLFSFLLFFFFQAEDGIRDHCVTGVQTCALPISEHFRSAVRTGLRYAGNNPHLRATLLRSAGFFIFASAYWALLPLVARNQIQGGPQLYGILLGAIGAGAVSGAFTLPRLKKYLGADKLVAAGTAGTAGAPVLFCFPRRS